MRAPGRRYSRRTARDVYVLSLAAAPRPPARAGAPPHDLTRLVQSAMALIQPVRAPSCSRETAWTQRLDVQIVLDTAQVKTFDMHAVSARAGNVLRSQLRPERVMRPVVRAFGTLAVVGSRPALTT